MKCVMIVSNTQMRLTPQARILVDLALPALLITRDQFDPNLIHSILPRFSKTTKIFFFFLKKPRKIVRFRSAFSQQLNFAGRVRLNRAVNRLDADQFGRSFPLPGVLWFAAICLFRNARRPSARRWFEACW